MDKQSERTVFLAKIILLEDSSEDELFENAPAAISRGIEYCKSWEWFGNEISKDFFGETQFLMLYALQTDWLDLGRFLGKANTQFTAKEATKVVERAAEKGGGRILAKSDEGAIFEYGPERDLHIMGIYADDGGSVRRLEAGHNAIEKQYRKTFCDYDDRLLDLLDAPFVQGMIDALGDCFYDLAFYRGEGTTKLEYQVPYFPPLPVGDAGNEDWLTLAEFVEATGFPNSSVRTYMERNPEKYTNCDGVVYGRCAAGRMNGVVWATKPAEAKTNKFATTRYFLRKTTPTKRLKKPKKQKK